MTTTNNSESSKPLSFIQKVLNFITGGDESKITRFHKDAIKFWQKQIKANQDEISQYNDKVEEIVESILDVKERLDEFIISIDIEKIKTSENTKEYVKEYTLGIASIEKEIKTLEEEMKSTKNKAESCNEQIEHYNRYISYLK